MKRHYCYRFQQRLLQNQSKHSILLAQLLSSTPPLRKQPTLLTDGDSLLPHWLPKIPKMDTNFLPRPGKFLVMELSSTAEEICNAI